MNVLQKGAGNCALFIEVLLRGAGQVLFQNHWLCGLLIFIGIFFDSVALGFAALTGLFLSTFIAISFKETSTSLKQGLFGYNGMLIGLALSALRINDSRMWIFIIAGALLSSVFLKILFQQIKISPLTAPFVLISWVLLGFLAPSNSTLLLNDPSLGPLFYFYSVCKSFSQVFLINNWISGVIFFIALLISSPKSAGYALLAAIVSTLLTLNLGFDQSKIESGLYGFSAILTAIAIGTVFYKPSLRTTFFVVIGICLTVLLQFYLNILLSFAGLPALTAPFILVTWLTIYHRGRN